MRIGTILRADNSGLGTLSQMFDEHIGFSKALVLDNGKYKAFPDRFPNAKVVRKIGREEADWLLTGIDLLLCFETPYDWELFRLARKRGVKTALIPMYECEPKPLPVYPDALICPSLLDYDVFKSEAKDKSLVEYLPIPIDRAKVPFRQRSKALVFQHNAGHGGIIGRNGTTELLAAIPMLKSDAKVIIYSQKHIDFSHPKCEIRVGNFAHYSDMWGDNDVFVFPHKFDGLSLPINEALSSGMPVLSTAIYPFTKWLPKEWFFGPSELMEIRAWDRFVDVAVIEPHTLAHAIDSWYGRDIAKDSSVANQLAEKMSWQVLKPKYLQLFSKICKTTV